MIKRRRVFIAINLPEEIKLELIKFRGRFTLSQNENFGEWAKWTSKDNLHITLEFLGDLADLEVVNACKITAQVAKRHKGFSINLNKILYAPPRLRSGQAPRMVWAEGEKSDELSDLKQDLEECLLEEINFRPEGRGFSPHITLARISEWEFRKIEPEERPEINEEIDLTFNVESIEVMESELKRSGPVYTILESRQLKE
jgi:2'-5' RNA ligase